MSKAFLLGILLLLPVLAICGEPNDDPAIPKNSNQGNLPLKKQTERITQEILKNGKAYSDLQELTALGPRLSGSEGAEKAVRWAAAKMKSYQFDRVWLQPTSVPHWERGDQESAEILLPCGNVSLRLAALGNSAGTAPKGITAQVIEVKSLKEVEELGNSLKGKIVFCNRPMNPSLKSTFQAYGEAVDQRAEGPAAAAKFGAAAALVRSMTTLPDDDHPHTGVTLFQNSSRFQSDKAIPAAALSVRSANELSRALKKDPTLKVKLVLSARTLPDVASYNVIGEVKGRQAPENNEIVLVGGHLDSWDLGTGAHDDGTGVVQSIEVLRAMKSLGITPKRTVRVVLFMAEEFGAVGAKEYAKQASLLKETHFAAIESDGGGGAPQGFGGGGKRREVVDQLQVWLPYLQPLQAASITKNGGGADIGPLEESGTFTFGLIPDSTHYFDFHHSALDRIEAVNKSDLHKGAAAMAVFAYLLAEEGVPSKKAGEAPARPAPR